MLNLRIILLLNVAVFVTSDAMGFFRPHGSRYYNGHPNENCGCDDHVHPTTEPIEPSTDVPTEPTDEDTPEATITPEPTEQTTPEVITTPEPTTTTTTVSPTTNTAEPTTENRYRVYCPSGRVFNRTATAENYYSGIVCTYVFTGTQQLLPSSAAGVCKSQVGASAFVTAPESDYEAYMLYNRTETFLINAKFPLERFTVVIDGKRKEECMAADTFNVAPCTATGTFEMASPSANPEYVFSHWGPGQPSNSVINGTVKSCLGMDQDLIFRDIFCDETQSPILNADNKTEYEVHAYYCALNPIREEL